MTNRGFTLRKATQDDAARIEHLILNDGKSPHNHVVPAKLHEHVAGLATGEVHGVVAVSDGKVIGAATYTVGYRYREHQPAGREDEPRGYIDEVVVQTDMKGRGVGTALLLRAFELLKSEHSVQEIYAKRHAENLGSAGMMRKAGMQIVREFYDPEVRPTGSRKTAVEQILV